MHSRPTTSRRYDVVPALRSGGERHQSLRDAAQIEAGLRSFLTENRFDAFTTNFQDLGALKQLPGIAPQRLMADGYGFAAEGDWKTAALLRLVKVMATDRTGGTSFMEDYTYHFGPGEPLILGAHMLEICPSITSHQPRAEIHPLGIGDREDPVRLVFDADPGPGFVVGILDLGDRFRLVANTIELVPPTRTATQPPRGQGHLETRTEPVHLGGVLDHRRRTTPHGPHHPDRARDARGPRHDRRSRARMDRRHHHPPRVHTPPGLEQRLSPDGAAMSATAPLALGIDYGTLSGRVLVLDLTSGAELASVEVPYVHGEIDDMLPGSGCAAGTGLVAAVSARLHRRHRARNPSGTVAAREPIPAA